MKEIESILGIEPTVVVEEKPKEIVVFDEPSEEKTDAEKDFELVRHNLISVVQKANEVVNKTLAIANDKEDARSFEVVNQFLNTITATSMSLLEAHKKKTGAGSITEDPTKVVNNTQNNIVFNGTPKQLKEFVTKMKEQENNNE